MQDKIQKDWATASSIITEWIKHQERTISQVENCCYDSNEILEWSLKIQSFDCYITLILDGSEIVLQLHLPLMMVPETSNQNPLFEELLRMNAVTLAHCSFGIEDDNQIVLLSDCSFNNLSSDTLNLMLEGVSNGIEQFQERNFISFSN